MENKYLNDLNEIETRAQKAALREVNDRIEHRWEQINRILNNGRPIWEQTNGDRFACMLQLRLKLITKMQTLCEAQAAIYEIMFKK